MLCGLLAMAVLALALSARPGEASSSYERVDYPGAYELGTIVIHTSERRLYYVLGDGTALAYRVAVGRPSEQWFGESWVSDKKENPGWSPTPSMRRSNPGLPAFVPPGPRNPLGVRAIYLGWGSYRIHGTNSPNSIGRAASSGCFRMLNKDVSDLYERVHIGAPVFVRR